MAGDAPCPYAVTENRSNSARQNPAMAQDSSRPDFWDVRYRDGVTPWDAGGVPQRLREWLEKETSRLRVLVPGCGSGYEVQAFAERGHDVLGIDFSDEIAKRSHVRKADFFRL